MEFRDLHQYQGITARGQQLQDSFDDYNSYLTDGTKDFTNPLILAKFNASLNTFNSLATATSNFGKKNNELVATVSR